jgi:hypothetical protein
VTVHLREMAVIQTHGVQSLGAATFTKSETLQPQVALVKERPALMAFYGRLKDKVFPEGRSENWAPGCWDPKERASVAR